jgi:hypothetical protein
LFLGRPFNVSPSEASSQDDDFPDGFIGHIPELLVDEEHSELKVWHETSNDLVSGKKCMLKSSLQAAAQENHISSLRCGLFVSQACPFISFVP